MSSDENWKDLLNTVTKVEILEFFSSNPSRKVTTQELNGLLKIPESTLSINLNSVEDLGLLKSKKEGKYKYYWLVNAKAAEEMKKAFEGIQYALALSGSKKAV